MVTDHHQIVMASTLIHAEQCIAGDLLGEKRIGQMGICQTRQRCLICHAIQIGKEKTIGQEQRHYIIGGGQRIEDIDPLFRYEF